MTTIEEPREGDYPEVGDWVLVWGQVTKRQTHPEDVGIEFYSHNANFTADIKVDRVRVVADDFLPEFVMRCTDLGQIEKKARTYLLRCTGHHGHGGNHTARDLSWDDSDTVGFIEEK